MTLYRKRPVVVEAITFDELVEHGKGQGVPLHNGMPWSFDYQGQPITHETDDCYLIPTLEGTMRLTRGDVLITGVGGEIYPCKREIFDATYESAAVKPERFFEGADNSSHHYLVPLSKRAEWIAWRDLPEDDENGWDAPEWAIRIDGGLLTFTNPKVGE